MRMDPRVKDRSHAQVRGAGGGRPAGSDHSAFRTSPLAGSKAKSFAAFAGICVMIEQGDHRRRDGLRQIIENAYGMNLGKRRLAKDDLLRALMRGRDSL